MAPTRTRKRQPAPVSVGLQALGEHLRKARTEAGLSQTQLGAPHFTRAYISAIELGKVRPAVKSLEFLAAKLGKPVAYFLTDDAEELRLVARKFDIAEAAALITRATAQEGVVRVEALLDGAAHPREAAQLHLMAGTALNFLIRGPEALRHLVAAERLALNLHDEILQRSVRYQLANAHRNAGDSRRGQAILREILADLERSDVPDRPLHMKVLKDLGGFSLDLGESDSAEGYYVSALSWANEIGDMASLISIYNGLAYAMRARGDLDAAMGYLQKALAASQVSDDLYHATVIHNALAVIGAERGHMAIAVTHADQAIQIARVVGPRAFVASCLNTKAECALKLRDFETARNFAEEELIIATEVGNDRAAAASRVVLADASDVSADSERRLKEAAVIYQALEARSEWGEVLIRLSRLAHERGDEHAAQSYVTQAYEVSKRTSYLPRR